MLSGNRKFQANIRFMIFLRKLQEIENLKEEIPIMKTKIRTKLIETYTEQGI